MERSATYWRESVSVKIDGAILVLKRGDVLQKVFVVAGQPLEWVETARQTPVPVLRSAILYCLALNVCSSEEIVDLSRTDPAVRYLCANHALDWQTVHEFRRRNAPILERALALALRDLARSNSGERLEGVCSVTAQKRLRRAMQEDSIALDV